MAILQISKIQQRSGNLVDLPQLDEAEFGWASDAKRLFIGKTTPNENIEVLTSYSTIDFSQVNGAVGNLNISSVTISDGQLLVYDGSNWVNRGGDAGGLITLGNIGNVKIAGGAIGYVLETDGTGNLAWTPKTTITAYVENATNANPCVITTTENNFFPMGALVTITDVPGMTQLNGNSFYANVISSNTFSLYTDVSFTTPVNSTAYGTFPYATVSETNTTTDYITVSDATPFTLNDPVVFGGDVDTANTDIVVGQTYYVKTKDTSAPNTWITISETVGGTTFSPRTKTGLSGFVYTSGGRIISSVGGSGTATAGGTTTSVQYNNSNLLDGDANFTWDFTGQILTIAGNANIGNLNTSGVVTTTRVISNVATGIAPPLTVTSTDRVSNLNVSYSNVTDYSVVTNQTTGTFYPVFASSSATGNRALGANANISFNAATGNLSVVLLKVISNANVGNIGATAGVFTTVAGNLTTAAQPNVTSVGTLTALTVNNTINAAGLIANSSTGKVTVGTDGGGSLSLGLVDGNSSTPYIDFNTSNTAVDYNIRLQASGAATGVGAGTLTISAATLAVGNVLTVGANANVTGNLNVTTNANITANLSANNGSIGNLLTVGANANVTGNLNVTTNANITANVNANNVNAANLLTVGANANVTGNLNVTANALVTGNVTASRIVSNIVTGTAPLTVTSTTRVSNLSVAYANVSDFSVVTAQTTGTYYPIFVSGSTSANYALAANSGISANIANGSITATTFVGALSGTATSATSATSATTAGTVTTAAQPNITSVTTSGGTFTVGNVSNGGVYFSRDNFTFNSYTGATEGAQLVLAWQGVSGLTGQANSTWNMDVNASNNFRLFYQNASGTTGTALTTYSANADILTGGNLTTTGYRVRSLNGAISAAGTTQGTATVLNKEINVVSTVASGSGVALPAAVAGMVLIVNNTNANSLNVYPASGAVINSGATNAAYVQSTGASIQYYATSSTQWYTIGATFA